MNHYIQGFWIACIEITFFSVQFNEIIEINVIAYSHAALNPIDPKGGDLSASSQRWFVDDANIFHLEHSQMNLNKPNRVLQNSTQNIRNFPYFLSIPAAITYFPVLCNERTIGRPNRARIVKDIGIDSITFDYRAADHINIQFFRDIWQGWAGISRRNEFGHFVETLHIIRCGKTLWQGNDSGFMLADCFSY